MGQSKFFNLFSNIAKALNQIAEAQPLIPNTQEPTASTETPNPQNANFYKADDFVYHRINGRWKRTPIADFNN